MSSILCRAAGNKYAVLGSGNSLKIYYCFRQLATVYMKIGGSLLGQFCRAIFVQALWQRGRNVT